MATWKLLEDMMLELKRKGVSIPANVMEDLRASKSMIKLSCMEGKGRGDAMQKAEELTANVEAFLVNEGQKVMDSEHVDRWLRRLEEANIEVCKEPQKNDQFVTGVPRDQKWVRIEPTGDLSVERIEQIAGAESLKVKPQTDGRLVVYGQQDNLKRFVAKMTQAAKQQL